MNFEIVPAHAVPLAEQAIVVNRAFAGYLAGWTELDAGSLGRFIFAQGIDLYYSRFAASEGNLVSFGYINRTADVPRLSGMATVPEARRTGAARYLLTHLLEEARARRDEAMVLEVFEQNPAAHTLYQRFQFRDLGRLLGWRRAANAGKPNGEAVTLKKISLIHVIRQASAFEYPDIPWQISRHAVAKIAVAHAFAIDQASIVIGDTEPQTIRIHGFFSATRDWNTLRVILRAIVAQFSGREFFAPAIFPEEFGQEIFEPLRFKREPLNQILMRRDL